MEILTNERVKKIKILQNVDPPSAATKEVIRRLLEEHECRFQYEGKEVPIVYKELNEKKDYHDFCREPEWTEYKKKQDDEWAQHYDFRQFSIGFAMKMKELGEQSERTCRTAISVIGKVVGLKTMQSLTAIISWHITGWYAYETWSWGENPYEPTVRIIEMGYVPRRLKDCWLVGYCPKTDQAL